MLLKELCFNLEKLKDEDFASLNKIKGYDDSLNKWLSLWFIDFLPLLSMLRDKTSIDPGAFLGFCIVMFYLFQYLLFLKF